MSAGPAIRVLLVGWFSFLHGEATAGDVLAWRAVCADLDREGIEYETAWSPAFRPGGLTLEAVRPARFSHLVFVCGPLHGPQIAGLHRRFRDCRRIAVGVSVIDSGDPAVTGFDAIIPRDAPQAAARLDLASGPAASQEAVPVVGVALTHGQGEYGAARRHERVTEAIGGWLREARVAVVPVETRLDNADWTLAAQPEQVVSVVRRLDVLVSTRLHGLVLGLANRVPVVAVDPVAGGGKVTAQAQAWRWPGVLPAEEARAAELERMLRWCLSEAGREEARRCAARAAGLADRGGAVADFLMKSLPHTPVWSSG